MLFTLRPTCVGRTATLICLATLLGACASTTNQRASGQTAALDLPDAQKVRELAAAPAPAFDISELAGPMAVERWELVAPLPTTIGHTPLTSTKPWEQGFAALVNDTDNTVRSEASACVARQYGHYYAENERWPDQELRTFIAARCGWIGGDFATTGLRITDNRSLDQIAAQFSDHMTSFLESSRKAIDGPMDAALNIERIGDATIATMVAAERTVTLKPRPITFDERGTIEGRVEGPRYNHVQAYIGEGSLSARVCERDPAARFPNFRFHCGGDSQTEPQGRAYVELTLDVRDQLFSELGGTTLLVSDPSDLRYVSATAAVPTTSEGTTSTERLAAQINAFRERSKLTPVAFSQPQSKTLGELLPHMLAAHNDDDEDLFSRLTLAAIAGWDIGSPILSGDFTMRVTAHNDPVRTMATLLTSPSARHMLFNADLSHIAMASSQDNGATSLLLSGYKRVPGLTGEQLVERALNTLNTAREAAGNRPVIDSGNYQQAATLLSGAVAQGKGTPTEATDRITRAMSRNLETEVLWWTLATDNLDDFSIPDALITARALRATVFAAPYQHPDDPWSIYRVVIMYAKGDIR
ncbi:hypothetical protein DV096_11295 [Bradymonadaceae bacterium TMQ3]|nr:hypothetical protein DV096_11295 [Bradymonadaceae bacterium TMQ3]TXC75517.1 hypothetical protein FRC91_12455 [Bradymonadales bacterium TMQ1]